MTLGDLGLQAEDSRARGLSVGDAREIKHAPNVHHERIAHRGEVLLAVVALVGQRDAALLHEDEVPLGIARVVVDEDVVEAREPSALELAHRANELRQ